jgi:hypothetical protein
LDTRRGHRLLRALEHGLQLLIEDRDSIKKQFEHESPDEDTPAISDEAAVPEMPEGVAKDYEGSASRAEEIATVRAKDAASAVATVVKQ